VTFATRTQRDRLRALPLYPTPRLSRLFTTRNTVDGLDLTKVTVDLATSRLKTQEFTVLDALMSTGSSNDGTPYDTTVPFVSKIYPLLAGDKSVPLSDYRIRFSTFSSYTLPPGITTGVWLGPSDVASIDLTAGSSGQFQSVDTGCTMEIALATNLTQVLWTLQFQMRSTPVVDLTPAKIVIAGLNAGRYGYASPTAASFPGTGTTDREKTYRGAKKGLAMPNWAVASSVVFSGDSDNVTVYSPVASHVGGTDAGQNGVFTSVNIKYGPVFATATPSVTLMANAATSGILSGERYWTWSPTVGQSNPGDTYWITFS